MDAHQHGDPLGGGILPGGRSLGMVPGGEIPPRGDAPAQPGDPGLRGWVDSGDHDRLEQREVVAGGTGRRVGPRRALAEAAHAPGEAVHGVRAVDQAPAFQPKGPAGRIELELPSPGHHHEATLDRQRG